MIKSIKIHATGREMHYKDSFSYGSGYNRTILSFTSYEELCRYNDRCTETRETHSREVLMLYRSLTAGNLASLIRYSDYVVPGKIILDLAYRKAYPNDSVRTLVSFQEEILKGGSHA